MKQFKPVRGEQQHSSKQHALISSLVQDKRTP